MFFFPRSLTLVIARLTDVLSGFVGWSMNRSVAWYWRYMLQVMDQEGENDHLMKAVMRALNSAEEKVLPITQVRQTRFYRCIHSYVYTGTAYVFPKTNFGMSCEPFHYCTKLSHTKIK